VVPELGKLTPDFLQKVILGRLGASRSELLQGAKFGVDNAVVRVATGTVAVCTTDPVSIIPALGAENSAWLSVNLIASDITTSGFPPAFAIFDLNLPPAMEDTDLEAYWDGIHRACKELGIAIIGGHTGRFVGCDYTIMGGGFMLALGSEEKYLTSGMAQTGDTLLLTKGAAIATTGILAYAFPNTLEKELGRKFLSHAQDFLHRFSTVKDALTAASIGVRQDGVTSMHDVTEGGVLGGLFELVSASGKGAKISKSEIQIAQETRQVCELFDIDPMNALGEGSLVISVRPEQSERVQTALQEVAIPSFKVGEVTKPGNPIILESESGESKLRYPEKDTYWGAYWKAVERGWN
jgi:hydrogenase expression/formation protein HypE